MLKNWRDIQSLIYLISLPLLVLYLWPQLQQQWQQQWHWHWSSMIDVFLYVIVLFLSVGISAVHHNHAHQAMWKNKKLNRLTNWWLSLLQGHPSFVFYASHNANHHRYHHGNLDVARTYRFGGDTNHLWGYITHPLQAVWVLYPLFFQWLKKMKRHSSYLFWYFILHYVLIITMWISLAIIHLPTFLILVLIPQLFALHWLLATNYLQHAHADGQSSINFARNFKGAVNFFCLNIGFHTAHHLHPRVHWSQLPQLHQQIESDIHHQLNAGPLFAYMLRTYLGSLCLSRLRSRSLMQQIPPAHSSTHIDTKENLCP